MDRDKALDEVGVMKLCCRNSSLLREKHKDKPKREIPEEGGGERSPLSNLRISRCRLRSYCYPRDPVKEILS